MRKVLCSTGALIGRPNNRDFRLLPSLTAQLSCDGLEFMMYDSWYDKVEELLGVLITLDKPIPVMHCEKHIGEAISMGEFEEAYRRFEINCQIAKQIGASKMVVHLWDGITSDAHFENNIEAYPRLCEIAKKYEVEVLVENVVCNQQDPMLHWCKLYELFPEIRFVYDTKMAAFHSQMELIYEEEYAWLKDNICHYHVNDYAGGHMEWSKLRTLPIGEGKIDFERFFGFLKEISYEGTFTVEATAFNQDGVVDTEMLNRQFEFVRACIY